MKKTVEQTFCDYPGCVTQTADTFCYICMGDFCYIHAGNVEAHDPTVKEVTGSTYGIMPLRHSHPLVFSAFVCADCVSEVYGALERLRAP